MQPRKINVARDMQLNLLTWWHFSGSSASFAYMHDIILASV